LIGFVGGSAEDLEIARPLLEKMCKRVEHVGNHGAGSMMKLAINLPLLVYWHTFAEALSLIQPLGLDPKRVVDIFSETSGGPNLLKNRGAFIAQSLIDGKSDTVNVTLNTVIKDLNAIRTHAQTLDRKLPLTELAMANFEASAKSGLGDADAAEHLVRWLKKA
jgi:3-hydroxyisobutyrate dehydrogenase